jgi:hypothetical protein
LAVTIIAIIVAIIVAVAACTLYLLQRWPRHMHFGLRYYAVLLCSYVILRELHLFCALCSRRCGVGECTRHSLECGYGGPTICSFGRLTAPAYSCHAVRGGDCCKLPPARLENRPLLFLRRMLSLHALVHACHLRLEFAHLRGEKEKV